MNLFQLKHTVAAYHQKEVTELNEGPVDLFLVAANNCRKRLEKRHDFELSRITATLTIDGVTGAGFSEAVIDSLYTPNFSQIRQVVDVSGLRLDNEFVPVDFQRVDVAIERDRYDLELSNEFFPANRYPSDAQFISHSGAAIVVQRGSRLYTFPRTMTTTQRNFVAYLEAYGWLNDYTKDHVTAANAAPQDFLVDHGYEYMQWSCIVELNYIFHTYVPRQEGNTGSPEQMMVSSYNDLLMWDSYLIDPNATRSR